MAALDLAAVPLFFVVRHLWLFGLHTANAPDWGYGSLNKHYFDKGVKFLKQWVDHYLD